MAITRIPHQVGTKIMQLPDEYSGSVGTICGITKINGVPAAGSETIKASAAVESGLVRSATIRLATGKIKSLLMLAANSPQVGALVGQSLAGSTIKSAHFSQRIELG